MLDGSHSGGAEHRSLRMTTSSTTCDRKSLRVSFRESALLDRTIDVVMPVLNDAGARRSQRECRQETASP